MPGFNPDKLNVHDLTIEEPEKQTESLFDPERDITDADWKKMDEWFRFIIENPGSFDQFPQMAMCLSFLKGEKQYLFNESEVKRINEILIVKEPWLTGMTVDRRLTYAANEKIAGVVFDKPDPVKTSEFMEKCRKDGGWGDLLIASRNLAILGEKTDISDDEWSKITKIMSIHRKESFNGFINDAVSAKILGRQMEVLPEDWDKMKKYLEENRQSGQGYNWDYFAKAAFNMTVLAADEVRIPEGGGLELIHHKKEKLSAETPQMPEQKQF